jgi:hypothetical protein
MKHVTLSYIAWKSVRDELHKEYPKSVFMLRNKMKTVLGFTVREHRTWIVNPNYGEKNDMFGEDTAKGWYEDQVHLDFYSENKRTMFLLKFSEIINNANTSGRIN